MRRVPLLFSSVITAFQNVSLYFPNTPTAQGIKSLSTRIDAGLVCIFIMKLAVFLEIIEFRRIKLDSLENLPRNDKYYKSLYGIGYR